MTLDYGASKDAAIIIATVHPQFFTCHIFTTGYPIYAFFETTKIF